MAVKYPKNFIPRSYFSNSFKERKICSFWNSSFNLSQSTPPRRSQRFSTQKRNKEYNLRNINYTINYKELIRTPKSLENSGKKSKKIIRTPEREKENSTRNSNLSIDYKVRSKRSVDCNKHTPNLKNDHPMRKKLRKLAYVSTPESKSANLNTVNLKNLKRTPKSLENNGKMSKKIICTPGRKKENSIRNSYLSIGKKARSKRSVDCIEHTPNLNEHPMRKKLRKLAYVSTPERKSANLNIVNYKELKRGAKSPEKNTKKSEKIICTPGKKKENSIRNSYLSIGNKARSKRSVDCIEHTPNLKTEHPMRKKLRKLAYVSTPESKSVTGQNLSVNSDLNSSYLLCNQRRVLNPISSKSLNSEYSSRALNKSPLLRFSTRSPISDSTVLKKNKISEVVNPLDCHTLKSPPDKTSYSMKNRIKDLEPVGKDVLVSKEKSLKVKSSLKTPVVKQNFLRSFRKKDKSENLCVETGMPGHISLTSSSNKVTHEKALHLRDSFKTFSTPITTRLKRFSAGIQSNGSVALPIKSPKENFNSFDSVQTFGVLGGKKSLMKTRSSEATRNVEGKEQKEFHRARGKGNKKICEPPFEKRITRSTAFNTNNGLSFKSSFPKKSKRHTFPSKQDLKKVPIDILTLPMNCFHESLTQTSKTNAVSAKEKAPKTSTQARSDQLMKTPVPKMSLKDKPTQAHQTSVKKEASKPSRAKNGPPITPLRKKASREKKTIGGLPGKASGTIKVPAKGTLRRKRWIVNTLKQKNEGHEDDIFENQKFEFPKPFFGLMNSDDESDSTDVSIATPTCGFLLSPNILSRRSPLYKPCISSTDLTAARRVAQEYLYRRNKTWKQACKNLPEKRAVSTDNEKSLNKSTEYSNALTNVLKAQADIEKLTQEESEEEDEYFSDVS